MCSAKKCYFSNVIWQWLLYNFEGWMCCFFAFMWLLSLQFSYMAFKFWLNMVSFQSLACIIWQWLFDNFEGWMCCCFASSSYSTLLSLRINTSTMKFLNAGKLIFSKMDLMFLIHMSQTFDMYCWLVRACDSWWGGLGLNPLRGHPATRSPLVGLVSV